ncbi:hypothetical protein DEIGR_101037 [Deinococcus grandis]|uniref:Uncharacterized protein n=1 Tax=Deinococcus grandis TaxID=57498 RepID=A0A100HHU3_9DEIO|nr:hypothetical protein [Deinococcus grandis]GAQ21010.1 hypothetical protein DEIGR_101037 [Deinococcus grandis]
MNASTTLPAPAPHTAAPLPYTPPTVTPVGQWQAVTLIGSVGFNGLPGMPGGPSER